MHNVFLNKMVDRLVDEGVIRTNSIERAFREVPRHLFLPGFPLGRVYRGTHITTKEDGGKKLSSSTAPWLMAGMLEQLQPTAGERILEVGAGTGYNAAILARLLGEEGHVSTLDIDAEVVDGAHRHLAALGLGVAPTAAGFAAIDARTADGALGDPEGAPWDGILVTVRSGRIPPAWFEQLAPGGRLVVPLTLGGMRQGELSIAFTKKDGYLASSSCIDCGFIRPRGGMAMADRELQLAEEAGLYWCDGGRHANPPTEIRALLEGPRQLQSTDLQATPSELILGFQTWLVLHDPETCTIQATNSWASWPALVPMTEIPGRVRGAGGLYDGASIALLALPDRAGKSPLSDNHPSPILIASYGGAEPAQRLLRHLRAWHQAGRPGRDRLQLRVYPPDDTPKDTSGADNSLLLRESWGLIEARWPE